MKTLRFAIVVLGASASSHALADWPYRGIKVECSRDALAVIDYSEYNEEGKARLSQANVIDVDKLSTWRHENDLNVPDKPLPRKIECKAGGQRYSLVLTNSSNGGYAPPSPVIAVANTSTPNHPVQIIAACTLEDMPEGETKIVFSRRHPNGQFFKNGQVLSSTAFIQAACSR
ncbi:hypothetical protein GCM10027321_34930 [Massilia terrae]|uniref:Uncharacterized protein n=1 Tax=Massilia terrae TaxID=1811224 RepID=A0ABT2D390_9BURK|nr:hypothetical protein [Massilia terrae]MCS0660702.1 hypothetical protein [Massilia terrae]